MRYALIRDGEVKNIIIADEAFIITIMAEWDDCVEVTNHPGSPGVGWAYIDGIFTEVIE